MQESICELPMLHAVRQWVEHTKRPPSYAFRIGFRPPGGTPGVSKGQIDVDDADGLQFAAELEALAALIRARLLRSWRVEAEVAAAAKGERPTAA